MADRYVPTNPPKDYDMAWLSQELYRISSFLEEMEVPLVRITPVHVEPPRPREGNIANADGTDWNPRSGGGLYQYLSSAWVPL